MGLTERGEDDDREDGLTTRDLEIGFAPKSGLRSGRMDEELVTETDLDLQNVWASVQTKNRYQ